MSRIVAVANQKGGVGKTTSCVNLGGALAEMGQVIGESNEKAEVPASNPISPGDMMSTILHTVFDVGKMRLDSTVPRNLSQLIQSGERIEELF